MNASEVLISGFGAPARTADADAGTDEIDAGVGNHLAVP